jgi:rhodanese-related sulfurtransferase
MADSIDINKLNRLMASGETPFLIDVRRKTDYEADPKKIADAIWRDPEKIEDWIKELPSNATTVVYCVKGGSVSQSLADRIRKEGLEAVFLEGGIKAWTENSQSAEVIPSEVLKK